MTPALWLVSMRKLFGCSDRMAHDLWKAFDVTSVLLFQLAQCGDPDVNDEAIIVARFERLSALIPPRSLLKASLQLAPETTRVRARQNVIFEEKVMRKTDHTGHWKR